VKCSIVKCRMYVFNSKIWRGMAVNCVGESAQRHVKKTCFSAHFLFSPFFRIRDEYSTNLCEEIKAKPASVLQEESCLRRYFVSCAGPMEIRRTRVEVCLEGNLPYINLNIYGDRRIRDQAGSAAQLHLFMNSTYLRAYRNRSVTANQKSNVFP